MYRQTEGQTDRQTDGQIDLQIHRLFVKWTFGKTDKYTQKVKTDNKHILIYTDRNMV